LPQLIRRIEEDLIWPIFIRGEDALYLRLFPIIFLAFQPPNIFNNHHH